MIAQKYSILSNLKMVLDEPQINFFDSTQKEVKIRTVILKI